MLHGFFHTKKEYPNGKVKMDLSTKREIAQARELRQVVCTENCVPFDGCGHCHIFPLDEELEDLKAILATRPRDLQQLWTINQSAVRLNEKLCKRYAWAREASEQHREYFEDIETTVSLMILRRTDGAEKLGITIEELDALIAQGKERWDAYDKRMGWLVEDGKRAVQ
jgi:hypothetical protein